MDKIKVNSSQYSCFFGNQIHFPYSIATNLSYANNHQEIKDNFQFEKIFFIKNNVFSDIEKCADSKILLCSCYCWNWETTTFLAREVKKINPSCLIIFGGPEVPFVHTDFFDKYPYVDMLVHNEGELILYNILKTYLEQGDLTTIKGTELKGIRNLPEERIKDLDEIPSPWSSDFIWELVDRDPNLQFVVSWETNRGCPYSCFVEDTKIITSKGPNKLAKNIQKGDKLIAFDEATGELKETTVVETNNRMADDVLKISFADGSEVKVTTEHPFYIKGQWVESKNVQIGDEIYSTLNGKVISIESMEGYYKVYNYSCYPYENYFANYVLCHNCTFCDWGSATKTKVRNFSEEKLFKEIDWFGKNNIIYIDVCDGNFGIFADRDYRIAVKLAEVKKATGAPEKLNLTWVKASSERVIPLAKVLNDAQLLRAISLSVQSLDANTLKTIKRSNIKFDNFRELVNKFDSQNLQSYTELIMGLPGETIQTYKNNWEILASIYPSPSILTWNCSVFNNAPMNDEDYKQEHGVEVFKSPMFMQHSSLESKDKINEYEKMVRRTKSLPGDDIIHVYTYNWLMLVFHAFGILEFIARYYNRTGMSYTKFYSLLEEYCNSSESRFADEYTKVKTHAVNGYNGQGWDHYDPSLGDISWPLEEASWLRLVRDKTVLAEEIRKFIDAKLRVYFFDKHPEDDVINDLLKFQMFIINSPDDKPTEKMSFNWVEFFMAEVPLEKTETVYNKDCKVTDVVRWGMETIWFGRRAQRCKTKLREISYT